jgi:uncharacterized membrane protein YhhN
LVFWVISVYFTIRNTLPKSGTFLLGHPVYIYIYTPHIPASFSIYLVINKCVTAVNVSNFSGHYLRNRSTLNIGVLGYIGILYHKEHPPEVWHTCIYKKFV